MTTTEPGATTPVPVTDEPGGEQPPDVVGQAEALRAQIVAALEAVRLPETGPVTGDRATGDITIALTTGPVTLQRPTFGQIRKLTRAEQHLTDRLKNIEWRGRAFTGKFTKDMEQFQGSAAEGSFEITLDNMPGIEHLRDDARTHADQMEDERDGELVNWWTLVFDTLAPGGDGADPETWPADLAEPGLPGRVVAHWKQNPVGPG